ncbi:MAG: hypothetical protein AAF512_10175 [Pseudomonadota bacterium]
MLRIILQVLGIIVLIPLVTFITIKIDKQNNDGPSILFPGGELVAGEMHTGPEPDWAFTDDVRTVELQLVNPSSSRLTFVMESDGKIYIPSGYMRSFLGRIWKEWAFQADEGDGLAVIRVNGMRYERQLVRVKEGDALGGIASKLAQKYAGGSSPEAITAITKSVADGDTWIFELAPREGTRS